MAVKHILRYRHGMMEYGLSYVQGDEMKLVGYSNAVWAGNIVDKKSTLGCGFSLGFGAFLGST